MAIAVLFSLFVVVGECVWAAHGDYTKTNQLLDELIPAFAGVIGSRIGGKAKEPKRLTDSTQDPVFENETQFPLTRRSTYGHQSRSPTL
jgi:hypothetical protein